MVKVCLKQFPEGSYQGQKGPGFHIDGLLKQNIDVFARNIVKDQQFVGLFSGNGTVRNGKSTIAQQIGAYYIDKVNEQHGLNLEWSVKNLVFKADHLIERAFELPKYSCIILDEGDDLTAHYFSKLKQKLNRFFRKSGQLNLFILLILPDFFEMPRNFAILRSNFLINVKFHGEFDRGYYSFYGPKQKKWLYLLGKRELNYTPKGVYPDFMGRFPNLYTVNEEEYRAIKLKDTMDDGEEDKTTQQIEKEARVQLVGVFMKNNPDFPKEKACEGFEISRTSFYEYLRLYKASNDGPVRT